MLLPCLKTHEKKRFDVSGSVRTPAQANVCVLGAAFSYQVMKDILMELNIY